MWGILNLFHDVCACSLGNGVYLTTGAGASMFSLKFDTSNWSKNLLR